MTNVLYKMWNDFYELTKLYSFLIVSKREDVHFQSSCLFEIYSNEDSEQGTTAGWLRETAYDKDLPANGRTERRNKSVVSEEMIVASNRRAKQHRMTSECNAPRPFMSNADFPFFQNCAEQFPPPVVNNQHVSFEWRNVWVGAGRTADDLNNLNCMDRKGNKIETQRHSYHWGTLQ